MYSDSIQLILNDVYSLNENYFQYYEITMNFESCNQIDKSPSISLKYVIN